MKINNYAGKVKFTSGPWIAEDADYFGDHNILWADGFNSKTDFRAIAAVVSNMRPAGEVLANARLIAAAPELYDALADMLSVWKYIRETHGDLYGIGWDRVQEKAEKAIAAAYK